MKKNIVLVCNSAFMACVTRKNLIESLQQEYTVHIMAPHRHHLPKPKGSIYHIVPFSRRGFGVFHNIVCVVRMIRLVRRIRPCALLSFTLKPNIYAATVHFFCRIPFIPNITGLGALSLGLNTIKRGKISFLERFCGWAAAFARWLYIFCMKKARYICTQNRNHAHLFAQSKTSTVLLPGSGVCMQHFREVIDLPCKYRSLRTFLFIGRLVRDKGIREYVQAMAYMRCYYSIQAFVIGPLDAQGGDPLSLEEIQHYESQGIIRYLGFEEHISHVLALADVVVLPSYHEGMPRVLLEAGAYKRPVIATDIPGCRDLVVSSQTGFLCSTHSIPSLVQACMRVVGTSYQELERMGTCARARVACYYREEYVCKAYTSMVRSCVLSD